ncbi:MAG TPA: ferritin-like domain-containing protein, partial [Acidimicrobiales bacterium]|nr:ferritin-like domain-containing protein [Acidimicrobiales bacterium]
QLELAALALHQQALGRGLLDTNATTLLQTFVVHHFEHHAVLGARLEASSRSVPTEGDPDLLAAVGPLITAATDAPTLLTACLTVETTLAATYTEALADFTVASTAAHVAEIQPVEAQHALVLGAILVAATDDLLPAFEPTTASVLPG